MHERLLLVEHSVVLLILFTGIGSGPAVGLIRDQRVRLVMMPILGFALTASLLTTVTLFLPLAIGTWTVLVPALVISIAAAVVLARRRPAAATDRTREIAVPIAALLIGITVALLPPLIRGTQGPFALGVDDAWFYTATSQFLEHHRLGEAVPAQLARTDLTASYGGGATSGNGRIGVDVVNASAATLFRSDTAAALTPFLAVLFGLIPLLIWLIVRGLGGSWQAAAVGAAFGLTPAILSMVEDTTLGNLAGEVLAAPALFFIARSLRRSSIADAVVAGALLGGLVAVFPEFLAPLFVVAACGGLVLGIDQLRHGALREWLRLVVTRGGIAAATAIVVAPNAGYRAIYYLSAVGNAGPWAGGLPARGINVQNVGAWGFGLRHLYEMSSFSALPASWLAFATYFPALLAGVVIVGIVARARSLSVFVGAPIVVAGALGIYTFRDYQGGQCEYCLWKSLTFMLPFLAVGLAFGMEWLWLRAGTRRALFFRRGSTAAVAIVALVALGYSDSRYIQRTLSTAAFSSCELRDLGPRLDHLSPQSPILIEGIGSMPQSAFMMPAAYFAARGHKHTVLFDVGYPAVQYLGLYPETAVQYYSPDYGYVLTPFEDVRSNRAPLGRYGLLLLERRAPIDVVVSSPGWAVDSTTPRIPWVSAPFRLRVASRQAVDAAITLSLARPAGSQSTLSFKAGQQQLEAVATNPSDVCVNVQLQKGETSIEATPFLDPLSLPPSWQLQKELGLAAIRAVPGRCATGPPVVPVSFYDGWYPAESTPDGLHYRWMASVGTVEVGVPKALRPSVRIEAQVASFAQQRRLDVWLGEKRLATVEALPTGQTELALVVPPGQGIARLLFVATPAAESASSVTPGDTRLLSVSFSHVSIRGR